MNYDLPEKVNGARREGMVMKNGKAPSEDAVKKEKLITELASGVKMLELGLPARLSKDSLGLVN